MRAWDELIDHFKSVAEVCAWDDANTLKWMRVRVSGRAATAFRRLPDATKVDSGLAKAAVKNRFKPETQQSLYQTRLQTRTKKKGEGWAEFGEDLKTLADKPYPQLAEEARELFALNQYLIQVPPEEIGTWGAH